MSIGQFAAAEFVGIEGIDFAADIREKRGEAQFFIEIDTMKFRRVDVPRRITRTLRRIEIAADGLECFAIRCGLAKRFEHGAMCGGESVVMHRSLPVNVTHLQQVRMIDGLQVQARAPGIVVEDFGARQFVSKYEQFGAGSAIEVGIGMERVRPHRAI